MSCDSLGRQIGPVMPTGGRENVFRRTPPGRLHRVLLLPSGLSIDFMRLFFHNASKLAGGASRDFASPLPFPVLVGSAGFVMKNVKTFKIMIYSALVCLLLLAPWMALHSAFVQGMFLRMLLQRAEALSGYTIQVGSFDSRPFSELILRDVKGKGPGSGDFEADTVRADYQVSLFPMRVHLRQVHLEYPVFRLPHDGAGRWALSPKASKEAGSSSGPRTPVRLVWEGARLTIASGTLLGVAANGDTLFQTRLSGAFQLDKLLQGGMEQFLSNLESTARRQFGTGN